MARYEIRRLRGPDKDGHQFYAGPVNVRTCGFVEVHAWAGEQFGEGEMSIDEGCHLGSRWCFHSGSGSFWFRDERDAFEFRMRWC